MVCTVCTVKQMVKICYSYSTCVCYTAMSIYCIINVCVYICTVCIFVVDNKLKYMLFIFMNFPNISCHCNK